MNHEDQINRMRLEILKDINDNSKDSIFDEKLTDAKVIALNALFPYDKSIQELPSDLRMMNWQVRCAIELYKKMGSTNVKSYSENGLSVTFLTGLISNELMAELGPSKAGVPK